MADAPVSIDTARASLAAHDGPRCGIYYRFEFFDDGDKIVSDGDCDHPAGHAGDCGPMQPQDDAPTWEELRAVLAALDEAEATILNERGEGEPPVPGWTFDPTDHMWLSPTMCAALLADGWNWSIRRGRTPRGAEPTARAAMRAASRAIGWRG